MSRPRAPRSRFIIWRRASRHHSTAKSYAETNWPKILFLYDKLTSIHRSPVYLLNRAIVVAEIEGPLAGIRALAEAEGDKALKNYHLFDATLGEFYWRAGDHERARQCYETAREKTHSPHDRAIIDRRLAGACRVGWPRWPSVKQGPEGERP